MTTLKLSIRIFISTLFIISGCSHFLFTDYYLKIMPQYLPWHLLLVRLSGILELALAILLLFPKWKKSAGIGLIVLLIAIFPANIQMAIHPDLYAKISPWLLWARLPLQFLLIYLVYWSAIKKRQKSSF